MFKRIMISVLMGIALGVAVRLLIPVSPGFIFSIVLMVVVLELLLEELEKDNAIKRYTKKLVYGGAVLLAFIGFRLAAGYLFDMPVVSTYALVVGRDVIGAQLNPVQTFMLEVLFVLPGLGLAYTLVHGGGVGRNFVYSVAVLSFFAVLWQVKQVDHTQATGFYAQSTINLNSSRLIASGQEKVKKANSRYAILTSDVSRIYGGGEDTTTGQFAMFKQEEDLSQGLLVKLTNVPARVVEGQAFVNIRLPEDDGSFVPLTGAVWDPTSSHVWIEAEYLKEVNGVEVDPATGHLQPQTKRPKPPRVVMAQRQMQEKVVEFKSGERVVTGLTMRPGDAIRYLSPTSPFRVWGGNSFHTIARADTFRAHEAGEIIVYGGDQGSGKVRIVVIPN